MATTCQICGRAIKAKNGFIAHHGYRRPGTGWQTASCMGAKFRPYEVACDALPIAIKSASAYRANQVKARQMLLDAPPDTLVIYRDGWRFHKPEGFNSTERTVKAHWSGTYEHAFFRRVDAHEREARETEVTIAELKKRGKWNLCGS